MLYPPLKLKKNEARRIRSGHLWIFSNEVDTKSTPLQQFSPGQLVTVIGSDNKPVGNAYINPNSLISARLLTRDALLPVDATLIVRRIKQALMHREKIFSKPFYRLIYGESDLLPGCIADRFDDCLVVQINTAGMEALQEIILQSLDEVIKPKHIILNNDTSVRELENLDRAVRVVSGNPPDTIQLEENDCLFQFPALNGQKTGWFFDHRSNRQRLQKYVQGKKVLDVFSYLGAWGIQAARAGARHVDCIEASASACEFIQNNARLNKLDDIVSTLKGDAFELLSKLHKDEISYDIVILDPPAFVKRKKDLKSGTLAYERINKLAVRLLNPGGILVSASCSYHFKAEQHLKALQSCVTNPLHQLQIIEQGSISPDHPLHPSIPETDYLSCYFNRLMID